ncbi:MAG: hypothetical protein EOO29_01620 [Comamonadaceae bacterium]|nr:MAG: hypothetical protein EOO29_01620 [Comamonadaceae bacterium]
MKLFSFPAASLERAIAKRLLTLEPGSRSWFNERWAQKPYKKAFVENKALPLVTLLAKGKTWDDETFDGELAQWDVRFHAPEVDVLMPLIEGDGVLQLMQKKIPPERIEKLRQHLLTRPAQAAVQPATPDSAP